jgi:hypothetical protein
VFDYPETLRQQQEKQNCSDLLRAIETEFADAVGSRRRHRFVAF